VEKQKPLNIELKYVAAGAGQSMFFISLARQHLFKVGGSIFNVQSSESFSLDPLSPGSLGSLDPWI